MAGHVFICYAREDEAFVFKLAANLNKAGIPIWLDQWDISPGASWNKSIADAIYDCVQFLVILSPAAVDSDQVEGEWVTLDENKPIIPVIHRSCRVPPVLRTRQRIDFSAQDLEDEGALEPLIQALGGKRSEVGNTANRSDQSDLKTDSEPLLREEMPIEEVVPGGNTSPYWTLPYGEPQWITIPAGEFWMGSDEKDSDADDDEKPLHKVFVSEFRIAPTPVTNEQYQLYVQATGAKPPQHWKNDQPPQDKLDHPVVNVGWEDAQHYCQWLSQETGKEIRLPTEAGWEKAARGDQDKRIYPWGDEFDKTKCNTDESEIGGTSAVGHFLDGASPYGCLDMSGNVWEWTQDWFSKTYYQHSPKKNPQGPDGGAYRSLRGGSWEYDLWYARVAHRDWFPPGLVDHSVGFRCASS